MPAYVIVDIVVKDPERYEEYRKLAPASIEAFGGKYLTRGGRTGVLEGDFTPNRLVIIEFESMEKARQWHESEAYREARNLRQQTAVSHMILVEGN